MAAPSTVTENEAIHRAQEEDYRRVVAEYGDPKRTIALILIAAIGMYIMCMSLGTCLSLRIAALADGPNAMDDATRNTIYSSITALGAAINIVAQPFIGALSDRTTSRWGRRKPWIAGCLIVSVIMMLGVGLFTNAIGIGICYCLGLMMMQCGFSIYSVIPAEGVPDKYRARVMGFMGMFGALATSFGSYLAGALVRWPMLLMATPVALGLITSIPLLVLYKDPHKTRAEVPAGRASDVFRGLFSGFKARDYMFVWITRVLSGFTIAALFSYFTYYLIDKLDTPLTSVGAAAGTLTLMSAPVSVIFFTVSGWISDKIGRRKPLVVIAGICMAVALVLAGTSHGFVQFAIAWELFAVGQAMYLTVDLALCVAVLPNKKDTGKDMSMFSVALSIGQAAAPACAPFFINMGAGQNYLLYWCVAAVLALVAAAMMPLVKGVK
ncbi:MFS transporter [Bifidobacterium vansinderenii]|uniref:Major Facilitator Superfamily n=1 Tax=Bifidobacterium vansinderenii TaxID=1984871 RepID=A0A229W0P7_9BIFI|nr:MFS transporter [Bifidobacterium vansinderenii]OXN01230.1 Major Facilitator Superfamily [Bifidobacterium vansinderenii]